MSAKTYIVTYVKKDTKQEYFKFMITSTQEELGRRLEEQVVAFGDVLLLAQECDVICREVTVEDSAYCLVNNFFTEEE
jgi:hypothetical protein